MNLELPLIPFIDFLLCIVLFLLSNFSGDPDPANSKDSTPPNAVNALDMIEAPLVSIVGGQILVDGISAGDTRNVTESNRPARIDGLFELLKSKREVWRQVEPTRPFPGVAVLRIGREVPAVVVKSVFQTAAFAGYPSISFMVGRRESTTSATSG